MKLSHRIACVGILVLFGYVTPIVMVVDNAKRSPAVAALSTQPVKLYRVANHCGIEDWACLLDAERKGRL